MKNSNLKSNVIKKIQFNSKTVKVKELEERKEMLVLWRRGEPLLPDFPNA